MTRPRLGLTTNRDRALQLIDDVAALGMDPVVVPCIEVIPASDAVIETARSKSAASDWLFLTSPRTVHWLWPEGGMPATKVAAVGRATAEAVLDAGGDVVVVGDGGGRDLAVRTPGVAAGQTVFFPHAAGVDRSIIHLLERAGLAVRSQVVYEIQPIPPGDDQVDAVMFGSRSAVTGWFLSRGLQGIAIGVIGKTTAAALSHRGLGVDVMPSNPSFGELARLMAIHLGEGSRV